MSVEFMKSLCMPIMLYGLEITDPTLMVFKTSGIFLNSYDVDLLCKEKRPTKMLSHAVLNSPMVRSS